ncbi:NAD(P)-binding protein [Mytilinidion resinicola]|uniref:Probable quinone oxidoreductase n=1 Tax=Mytilinidion resinicola TaxID=574789 RepID=A0A6A6Z7E5_9PEZI|nr:NAD(P)-binding protein [Mytilinidion resinicola]KAF2816224.1 NAD(P)-binding protein [Mytilinidion resinicola]
MKGVWIEKTGGTEVLQYKTDIQVPELKEGEVLVKNEYIGVNYIDTYFRTGLYAPPHYPYILGREGAGTIAALGPNTPSSLSLNSSVVYMHQFAYAEYTPVPAHMVVPLPPTISPKTAAAAIIQGLTALTLIRDAYPVQRGDWILVHAAAGGVGLWLVQLLKAVGARTIATASTAEKRELAKTYGAEVTLEYFDNGDVFVKKVLEVTGGKGVSAVFDGVGKATFDASLGSLARKGSLVSFGNASGAVPPVTISRLTTKNAKLLRPNLFTYISEEGELEKASAELWDFIVKDKMDPRIHEVYPLKDIVRVHQDLEGRKTTGKLLLQP